MDIFLLPHPYFEVDILLSLELEPSKLVLIFRSSLESFGISWSQFNNAFNCLYGWYGESEHALFVVKSKLAGFGCLLYEENKDIKLRVKVV